MKWAIIALAIILFLLIIVMITKLTIHIDFRHSQDDDYLIIKFSIWFGLIHYTIQIPMVKIEKESPGIVFEQENSQSNNTKNTKITPEEIMNRLKDLKELLEHVVKLHKIVKRFLKKVSVLEFKWSTGFGTGDASQTGLFVGVGWALKGSIIGLISQYFKLTCNPNLSIHPYYQHFVAQTHLKCMFRFRIGNAMLAGIRLVKYWKGGRPYFRTAPLSMLSKKDSKESMG